MYTDELVYIVALNKVFRYNPKISNFLLKEFGTAETIFRLDQSVLMGIFNNRYSFLDQLSDRSILTWAKEEICWAESKGVRLININDSEYPASLKECFDPPLVLYIYGEADLNQEKIISIVGTRMSTRYGTECCRKIIRELLDSGCTPVVVSGLAYGVDVAAHKAALESGLKTVAVLPNGLDRIYPSAHHEIAKKISRQGAVISEFPRATESLKINFIQRNRLIAALSKATIVIESRSKGGALITAELAQSYSREVFAIPGRLSDPISSGCNNLIFRNIANIFSSTRDFMTVMNWGSENKDIPHKEKELFYSGSPEKEKILVALRINSELNMDELLLITGAGMQSLCESLLELELEGYIHSLAGKRYSLA
ncbi:MAG: DNA protecting protein DprA [Bacteroidetes bacterium GWF2_40_14]|nr:MAG: DNA protecting protein DprA [Bacteroidetes bacterium GWF2_40_14]